MKKLLLLGIILLLAGCMSYPSKELLISAKTPKVFTSYDDMTGVKETEVRLLKSGPKSSWDERFDFTITEKKGIRSYYICFSLNATNWWFIDTLLVKIGNNEAIIFESTLRNRNVLNNGKISELVIFKTSLEIFQIIANTENIRFRIIGKKHQEDYEITPEDQIKIKMLLVTLK